MYSVGDGNSDVVGGLYINMYGGNKLSTKLKDGSRLQVEQQTNYPWDGNITVTIKEAPDHPVSIHLRIPGWCNGHYHLKINGKVPPTILEREGYRICSKYEQGIMSHEMSS